MTEADRKENKRGIGLPRWGGCRRLALFGAMLVIALIFSAELADGVRRGLRVAVGAVIPAGFIFYVISDYLLFATSGSTLKRSDSLFSRIFGVSGALLPVFIAGNVCGFPIGAAMMREMHREGVIDREDANRMLGLSTAPSAGFMIGTVGVGIFGNASVGTVIYASLLISTVAAGIICRGKTHKIYTHGEISRQKFNLVESIGKAGGVCVSVSSFIIFFSALSEVMDKIPVEPMIKTAVIGMSELGTGVFRIADAMPSSAPTAVTFIAGWSGICAMLQAFSLAPSEMRVGGYILRKLLIATLASTLVFAADAMGII